MQAAWRGEGNRIHIKRQSERKRIEPHISEGIADVRAALFDAGQRNEKAGFAMTRLFLKDLKTARNIVEGYLNYARGRHKRSNVVIKRLSLAFEKGRGAQIGSFFVGMGKPAAKAGK